jgi:hypothetical protein
MWACSKHIKEALTLLETPHISISPYRIKCSLCDNRAIAKVYYAHKPFQLKKNQKLNSLSGAPHKKIM